MVRKVSGFKTRTQGRRFHDLASSQRQGQGQGLEEVKYDAPYIGLPSEAGKVNYHLGQVPKIVKLLEALEF